MDGRKRVAWNLRRIRVAQDLSQESLAADAEVDRTYMGKLERGLENPTVGLLDRIAKTLGTDIAEFFIKPKPNDPPPKPLKGGRRSRTVRRSRIRL
jgi:transcriptional regulator with XRE-family HTH domain